VQVDELHRPGERSDPIGDPVLRTFRSLFCMLDEDRVRLQLDVRHAFEEGGLLHVITAFVDLCGRVILSPGEPTYRFAGSDRA